MDEVSKKNKIKVRLGILFILIWWLPFWLVSPVLSDIFGANTAAQKHQIFIIVIVVQTIFGVLGFVIASKPVVSQMRHVSYKKFPKTFWNIFKTGNAA